MMNLQNDKRNRYVLLAASLVMVYLYGHIDRTLPQFAGKDLACYRAIADAAPSFTTTVPSPLAYRILGPYVIGLLPLDHDLGFLLFTSVGLLIVVQLFYGFLRRQRISPFAATITGLLWMFNKHAFGFMSWDYFQIDDVIGILSVIVAYDALIDRRWIILALTMMIGVLARETALLMIPTAFAFCVEQRASAKEYAGVVAASVLSVAVYFVLRVVVPSSAEISHFYSIADIVNKASMPETWYRILINAALPLTFVPLVCWSETKFFFKRRKHLLVFMVAVLFSAFMGGDDERLVVPALVMFYWLVAQIIEEQASTFPAWWPPLLIGAAFLSTFNHLCAQFPLPSKKYTIVVSLLSMFIATTGTRLARRRSRFLTD